MPHLLIDISSHGFGHVAQTAPVLNALHALRPDVRMTVRTTAPHSLLEQRIHCPFEHIPHTLDFGMRMHSAIEVDLANSATDYRAFHTDWEARVAHEAHALHDLRPDLLLANVPYLSLAAAQAASIPSVALCSLNWSDIFGHYLAHDAEGQRTRAVMQSAYRSALAFLKVEPAMPMSDLPNSRSLAPIVHTGHNRRDALTEKLKLSPDEKIVLSAMGGMDFRLPMECWPETPGLHWLIPKDWGIDRKDCTPFESLGIPFNDLLASCDAVLTKPGYGTFAEAACAGIPVLYVSRGDWPEQPYLVNWLERNGRCLEVSRPALETGKEAVELLKALWQMPVPPRPHASGADEAAHYLNCLL